VHMGTRRTTSDGEDFLMATLLLTNFFSSILLICQALVCLWLALPWTYTLRFIAV
jgi:hypothetical protein